MPTYTSSGPGGDVLLANALPEAEYMYGCTPTAVAMILGYYDLYGYRGTDLGDLIEGDVDPKSRATDGNAYNMNAFDTVLGKAIATEDFVYRFHARGGRETTPKQELAYAFSSGTTMNTDIWNCLADYLGTGQYWRNNANLSTTVSYCSLEKLYTYDHTITIKSGSTTKKVPYIDTTMLYGLDLYVQSRGYSLDREITGTFLTDTAGGGFTFADYMREIDAGRPVLISIEGHSMTGFGYNAATQEIVFDDCYQSGRRMVWGGTYRFGGVDRNLQAVTVIAVNTGGDIDLALDDLPGGAGKLIVAPETGAAKTPEYCFEGSPVYLTCAVSNLGAEESGEFGIAIRVDGALAKRGTLESIPAETARSLANLPLGELSVGLHNVRVVLDEENDIQERSGSNNAAETDLVVLRSGTTVLSEELVLGAGESLDAAYVRGGGVMTLNGGTASGVILRGLAAGSSGAGTAARRAKAVVSQGGLLSGADVGAYGEVAVSSGGRVAGLDVASGGSAVVRQGGTASNVSVGSGGRLWLHSGGLLTGRTRLENGASVTVYSGGVLNFDVSSAAPGAEALANDLSRIGGSSVSYTLTVSETQAGGTYRLADGAAGFSGSITVANVSGGELGVLENGGSLAVGDTTYTLNLKGAALTLTVTEPEKPVFFTGDFAGTGRTALARKYGGTVTICDGGTATENAFALDDGWDVAGTGDLNGDGRTDFLLIHDASGLLEGRISNGDGTFAPVILDRVAPGRDLLGTGDFNGNGRDDVLEADPTGVAKNVGLLGFRDGGTGWDLFAGYANNWEFVTTGDFNGDGTDDMLWRTAVTDTDGVASFGYCTWLMGLPEDETAWKRIGAVARDEWEFLDAGDFNGDGTGDIAMVDAAGSVNIWEIEDGGLKVYSEEEREAGKSARTILSESKGEDWSFAGVGDFNGDGTDDFAWYNASAGTAEFWEIGDMRFAARHGIAIPN